MATTGRPVALVVEDEQSAQGSLCAFLHQRGFATLQAETVEAALKIPGQDQVDAVILDLRLPDPQAQQRSGLELLAGRDCARLHEPTRRSASSMLN